MKRAIRETTENFTGAGGVKLFCRRWCFAKPAKAVLVFIHGLAEHSGRYRFPIKYFVPLGFTIYVMDLRGHGDSEGRRGYAESIDHLLEDIRSFLALVKEREPKKKVFLVGHSFGGQLVLNYGALLPDNLSGIIVSSPNVELAFKVAWWKKLAAPFLSRLLPTLALPNDISPALISRDQKVVEAYKRDERVQKKITARLGDIVLAGRLRMMDLAGRFQVPCLLMHAGDDRICSPEGTREFFEKIPIRDKTLKIYEGFYHELFNDPGKERVFRDMEEWICERL